MEYKSKFIKIQGDRYINASKKNTVKTGNNVNAKTVNLVNNIKTPIKSPVEKVLFQHITTPLLMALAPNDLLALYISDKQFNYFNNKTVLDLLNLKYNTNAVSFTDFIKKYNKSIINPQLSYLYQLENEIELPSVDFVNNFVKAEYTITNGMRAIVLEWMFNVARTMKYGKDQPQFIGLSITYLDSYLHNNHELPKEELQLVAAICMYLAEYMILDDRNDIYFYRDLGNGAFTYNQFINKMNDVFIKLNGILIRPTTSFFIDMTNETTDLVNFSYLIPELIKFKPSMIAEAISHIVYGNYKIYDLSELNQICKYLYNYIGRIGESGFNYFKIIGKKAEKYMKNACGDILNEYKESDFKYAQPWHLGDYQKIKKIGQGAYGKVVKISSCGTDYVIKTNLEDKAVSLMEISIIKQMKQPNVINICNFQLEQEKVKIIMPFMDGSLDYMLKNKSFNKQNIVKYFKQICMGLQECHKNDIIHRDIKIENIVYDEKNDLFKLIDFGISVSYSSTRDYLDPNMACTFTYRAPEALLLNRHYNYKVDIWALGVVFYYVLTNKYLYNDYDNVEALDSIFKIFGTPDIHEYAELYKCPYVNVFSQYPRNFKYIDEVFGQYKQMIVPCFVYDFNKRPDTTQLLNILEKYY
jgi:RIO-like serine/threonine protein kinase